jgi:hypothetical protein
VLVSYALVPFSLAGLSQHVSELANNSHTLTKTETGICIQKFVRLYGVSSTVSSAGFDTLVFFFVSYRIVSDYSFSTENKTRERAWAFYRGQKLSRLSRMLLQSGQKYFLYALSSCLVCLLITKTQNYYNLELSYYRPLFFLQYSQHLSHHHLYP